MPRAVLFDLFNTLIPGGDDGTRDAALATMAGVLGVDPTVYVAAFNSTWSARHTGAMGDLAEEIREVSRLVGGAPDDDRVAAAAVIRQEMNAGLFAGVPDATLSALDGLRAANWSLGLVSNTSAGSPEEFRGGPLAPRFEATGFSNEIGIGKPDPRIYLAVCQRLGVAPTECVYVGDGADDELAAAAALGMHAIRATEHADTDPAWTGPTIAHLTELPPLLAARPDHLRPGWVGVDLASGNIRA
jgi:putative hydrolase of the HAD superfamily